jgi:hypothetical protein
LRNSLIVSRNEADLTIARTAMIAKTAKSENPEEPTAD